jgi:hypothetical protein
MVKNLHLQLTVLLFFIILILSTDVSANKAVQRGTHTVKEEHGQTSITL